MKKTVEFLTEIGYNNNSSLSFIWGCNGFDGDMETGEAGGGEAPP